MPTVPELLAIALQHHQTGRLQEAEQIYRQILAAEPNNAEAQYNLGRALKATGQLEGAADCYHQALQLRPDIPDLHVNLGNVFTEQGQFDNAIVCYLRALAIQPNLAEAHYNLGSALRAQGKIDEAIASFRQAVALKPDFAEAHNNLGDVLHDRDKLDEAVTCYRQALARRPDYAIACHNLGIALQEQGKYDEAANSYRRAIQLNANLAEAHANLALIMLLNGDCTPGLSEYEWRWKTRELPQREFKQPQWSGERLNGKTILLHAEQGMGDTIQFVRYAQLVKQFGGRVLLECQRPLVRLIASCAGIDQLVPTGDQLPTFDVHAALLSLPRILKTVPANIPQSVSYLYADQSLLERWRARLENISGFRVGINWRGRAGRGPFRKRDLPLDLFATLTGLAGVRLISLQKG